MTKKKGGGRGNHLFEVEGEAEVVCVLLTSLFRCVLSPEFVFDEYVVNFKLVVMSMLFVLNFL